MVSHIFDCLLSFSEPPEVRTVEGFSAIFAFVRCEDRLCSQTTRATNCATPGCIILFYIATLIGFLLSVRGASLRNIVAALRLKRSLRSLFLHLGAMPSSATGGGLPPRPTAPHPVVLCFLVCFLLIDFLLSIRGASLRNIVAALCPTEGQTPQKPFKFAHDILPFLARFVNLDEDVIGGKYPRLYFP